MVEQRGDTNFVRRSYSPFVAVMCSPGANDVCFKNNLSFVELVKPFCETISDVSVRDPSGLEIILPNFSFHIRNISHKVPDSAIIKAALNDTVASTPGDAIDGESHDAYNIAGNQKWFENWRESFFEYQVISDHEFSRHYIACIMVVASSDPEGAQETLSNMAQQLQQMLGFFPSSGSMPKWFSSSILRYYVLLHDNSGTCEFSAAEQIYDEFKLSYNPQYCHLLVINSASHGTDNNSVATRYWPNRRSTTESIISRQRSVQDGAASADNSYVLDMTGQHPLSPFIESAFNVNDIENSASFSNDGGMQKGVLLTEEDVKRIEKFVNDFVTCALVRFAETQLQYLNDTVSNKKGVSKSIFSATKRWFGAPVSKSGMPAINIPSVYTYQSNSLELQQRRLGDLCFMFGLYNGAFQAYYSAKRDFYGDGAWLHYASTVEMLALCCFLIGSDIRKGHEYTDECVTTYLNVCRMPQLALRAVLCISELMKDEKQYGEAAKQLILMTSEDSDLQSALLLEQAACCFLKCRLRRKCSFHLVLAGHRYLKAGHRKHSLRCYKYAREAYENKDWCYAEDHVNFTMGRIDGGLNNKTEAVRHLEKLFRYRSRQSVFQQMVYIKEYLSAFQILQDENIKMDTASKLHIIIPQILNPTITVELSVSNNNQENVNPHPGFLCATGSPPITQDVERWYKLEENCVSFKNNNSLPVLFRPTINFLSNATNNSIQPVTMLSEAIRISVKIRNLLEVAFSITNIHLTWQYENKMDATDTAYPEVQSIILNGYSEEMVTLCIVPLATGVLRITGIQYEICVLEANFENVAPVKGWQPLQPTPAKVVSRREAESFTNNLRLDYRLNLQVVDSSPRLQVFCEDVSGSLFCGELREIKLIMKNVGDIPIENILLTTSHPEYFSNSEELSSQIPSVPMKLLQGSLMPGEGSKVKLFIKSSDVHDQIDVDTLFYYEGPCAPFVKIKYRLLYHRIRLNVMPSLEVVHHFSKSMMSRENLVQMICLKLLLRNHSKDAILSLIQLSLHSDSWKLDDSIMENVSHDVLTLNRGEFTNFVVKLIREGNGKASHLKFSEESILNRRIISSHSILTIFWKAESLEREVSYGEKHIVLGRLDSDSADKLDELKPLSVFYKHSQFVTHDFLSKRLCVVPINLFLQNTSDDNLLVSLHALNHSKMKANSITENKMGQSAIHWVGKVDADVTIERHGTTRLGLSLAVTLPGTYDVAAHLNITATPDDRCHIFHAAKSQSYLFVSDLREEVASS